MSQPMIGPTVVPESVPAQSVATVVESDDVITFEGRPYRVADRYALMPLLRFAHIARAGATTDDMESLDAVYGVLRAAIHRDDWDAFCDHSTQVSAELDELMPIVTQAIGVMTARPTKRPSDSSDGPTNIAPSSSAGLSSPDDSTLSPIQRDPRFRGLVSVDQLAAEMAAGRGPGMG